MKRYIHLSAGASWMAEYGNPDTADWKFIKTFSPYQNLKKDGHYPPVLFYTTTSDDRVGPVQARKMAAKMHPWACQTCGSTRTSKAATAPARTTSRPR